MISEKMQAAINEQINKELYSEYLYLSMASYFDPIGLKGFANWMRVQVKEERAHALMMYTYVNDAGGRVTLAPIDGPRTDWESPLAVFEDTLEHERLVTSLIYGLVNLAIEEKDHATNAFLQWFITEQVEEEKTAKEIGDELRLAGGQAEALFMLDRERAARIFTPPPAAVGVGVI